MDTESKLESNLPSLEERSENNISSNDDAAVRQQSLTLSGHRHADEDIVFSSENEAKNTDLNDMAAKPSGKRAILRDEAHQLTEIARPEYSEIGPIETKHCGSMLAGIPSTGLDHSSSKKNTFLLKPNKQLVTSQIQNQEWNQN